MAKRRGRRNWTDEEKIEICCQTTVPGVSASRVARRYDVSANQVFNWLKDPRFKPDGAEEDTEPPVILPIKVVPDEELEPVHDRDRETALEITLSNGRNLRVSGTFDPDIVARLIRRLDE